MALTEKEKDEIQAALKEGKKISEIEDMYGVSRETIRKVKNGPASKNSKPDLKDFNQTFDLAGAEKTADELLKAVGNLAPQILKERLEAGELVLSICGGSAAAAGLKLEDLLKALVLLPIKLEQSQAENQNIIEINRQLQEEIEKQLDNMVITKTLDRVMSHIMIHGENKRINLDVLYAYGLFLKQLKTEDPKLFNAYRTLATQPDSMAIAQLNAAG